MFYHEQSKTLESLIFRYPIEGILSIMYLSMQHHKHHLKFGTFLHQQSSPQTSLEVHSVFHHQQIQTHLWRNILRYIMDRMPFVGVVCVCELTSNEMNCDFSHTQNHHLKLRRLSSRTESQTLESPRFLYSIASCVCV